MLRPTAAALLALAWLAACDQAAPGGTPDAPQSAPAAAPASTEQASAAFDQLVDSITYDILRESPEGATYLGLPEEKMGGPYLGRLDDHGLTGRARGRELLGSALAKLEGADPAVLDDSRRLTRAVLLDQLGAQAAAVAAAPWGDGGYALTQFGGIHIDLPNMMANQQPVTSTEQAAMYVERLRAFGEAFDQTIEVLKADQAAGSVPPDFILQKSLDSIAKFTADAPTENSLYTTFARKLDEAQVPEPGIYLSSAEAAIGEVVYPAYGRLALALEELKKSAAHDAGISHQPKGAALYQALIKLGGDSNLAADAVHQLGLDEVARIAAEQDALLVSLGRTEGTVAERMLALAKEPERIRPDTEEGKASIIADLNRQIAEIRPLLPQWFGTIPPQPLEIRRVPAFSEASAAPGYYDLPSLDGSRPGIYWINLRDTAIQPDWLTKTVTYHEGIPGHHLQLSLAFDQKDLPLARKLWGSTTAFAEGWGLYAERLAKEMGLYEGDPYGDLGRLRWEMHRAARLVVDSGMHAKGWSREQAIDYMVNTGGIDPNTAEQEIERYVAIPGQALGYKIGMLKILELRERAKTALGEKFDIRQFHDAVLLDGGLPLGVLETRIDEWIAAQKAATPTPG